MSRNFKSQNSNINTISGKMCVMPAAISDVSVVSKDTNFVRLFKLQKYRLRQHPFGLGKRFQVLKCNKKQ